MRICGGGSAQSPTPVAADSQKIKSPFSSPPSAMGNFIEVELDEFLTIFKLPPGGNRAEKERRIKGFMAANRGQLGQLCTCSKHMCSKSDQDDNSIPHLPLKTLESPPTTSTHLQTGLNPTCAKFSSYTDSNPQCFSIPISTSSENPLSESHVTSI